MYQKLIIRCTRILASVYTDAKFAPGPYKDLRVNTNFVI